MKRTALINLVISSVVILTWSSCNNQLSDDSIKKIICPEADNYWDIIEWRDSSASTQGKWMVNPAYYAKLKAPFMCHDIRRNGELIIMEYYRSNDSLFRHPQWNGDVPNVIDYEISECKFKLYNDTFEFVYLNKDSFELTCQTAHIKYIKSKMNSTNEWGTLFRP